MKATRPWSVTWLAVYVLTLVAVNFTQAAAALQQWQFLSSRPLSISPLYLVSSGTLWGLAGTWLFFRIWTGRPGTPKIVILSAFSYIAFCWMESGLLVSNLTSKINAPFNAAASVIVIILIIWILSRPKARNFFGVMND